MVLTAPAERNEWTDRPRRPEPVRASLLSQVAVMATIALAMTSLDRVADSADLRSYLLRGWLCMGTGLLVGTFTPASRPFRRVSAWLGASAVAGLLGFMAWNSGSWNESSATTAGTIALVVLGLDLRWVSRLRVVLFVSGIALIPILAAPATHQMLWAGGWLAALFVSLWLLGNDTHRSVDLAEPKPPGNRRPVSRLADLGRILVIGLAAGVLFSPVLSSPSYQYRPLQRLVKYLPFRPDLVLDLDLVADLDIRDYEIDANGHESKYFVEPEGRRFVVDPLTRTPYAVVERSVDGATVDQILTRTGEVVATIGQGASILDVPGPDRTTTYLRDDVGWFTQSGVGSVRPILVDDVVRLVDLSGNSYVDSEAADVVLPPAAVLHGTASGGSTVERIGDFYIRVREPRRSRREYDRIGDNLFVHVRRRSESRLDLSWNEDRSSVEIYVEDFRQSVTLDMDRTGNIFDKWPEITEPPASSPSTPWRRLVTQGLLAIGVLGVAGFLFLRFRHLRFRRRGTGDRDWAESQLHRLERFGAAHKTRREPTDTVVTFTDRCARELDGDDDRLRIVGDTLDDALFGQRAVSENTRRRTEAVLDTVIDRRRPHQQPPRRNGRTADPPTPTPVSSQRRSV